MSHENLEVPSHHQSMSALDCPRYLNHMKAHDQADKVMAELEYRAVQSKLNRENRLKEVYCVVCRNKMNGIESKSRVYHL